jgi:uncharacterized protein
MKKYFYIIISILLLVFLIYEANNYLTPISSVEFPHVVINDHVINVTIGDDYAEQVQGLSERPSLKANEGMLFIFPNKQVRNFWMKNMNFSIDIIWLDDNKVLNISQKLLPEGENPDNTYSSILPVNKVLEINAGLAERYGLKVGDSVKINL